MSSVLPNLSEECFFIAPIGADGSPERERSDGVLEFIVGAAAQELSLTAVRADQLADPGQITLQVIDHILGARAAVADLTGLNPNVFYELAVRHTARLPVALIVEKGSTLPFDIAQMRTIFFDSTNLRSADQCRREIVSQLNQALNDGAVDSPIATSVDVRALAGGSAVERNVAEIVTAVEEIAKSQRTLMQRIDRMNKQEANRRLDLETEFAPLTDALEAYEDLEVALSENPDANVMRAFRRLGPPLRYLTRKYNITPLRVTSLEVEEE
jgi:hypothetical protein